MPDGYRPSWYRQVDANRRPIYQRPSLLLFVLTVFGVLAGAVGLLLGAAIHGDGLLNGVPAGVLWASPYLFAASLCWEGPGRRRLVLAQALGIWGAIVPCMVVWGLWHLGNVGGGSGPAPGAEILILLALVAGNLTIVGAAATHGGRYPVQPPLDHPDGLHALVPFWFVVALLIG